MKKILIALMLAGCGAQTPDEQKAEDYAKEFVEDCVRVYGEMCTQVRLETAIVVEDYSEIEPNNTCWTEDGTNKRGLGLTPATLNSNNKAAIYKEMLECTAFATEHTVNFVEFAERLGLK
jgi:hypothetical protein